MAAFAFVRQHLHVLLYAYFWFAQVVSALAAPDARIVALGGPWITRGWHLALLATAVMAPALVVYVWRWRRAER